MVDQTIWKVYNLLPDCNTSHDDDIALHSQRVKIIEGLDNSGIDFSTFYQTNGAKISRPLKAILEAALGKVVVAQKFADFCRELGSIYSSFSCEAKFIKPYFTHDQDDYGDSGSCFRPGGCNEQNGRMIDGSPCMAILTLTPVSTDKYARGRMVIQILDSTHVLLTNRYSEYGKGEIPTNIYVRALETMCRAEITFKKEHHPEETNIFYNNTPWIGRCTKGNFDNLTMDYRIICSNCGTHFVPSEGFTGDDGPCVHCCSEECRDEAGGERYECFECGRRCNEDDVFCVDDEHYCERCYSDNYFHCECCEECFRNEVAMTAYHMGRRGRMTEVTVCEYCAENNYTTCDNCADLFNEEVLLRVEDATYCQDCAVDLTKDCKNCTERFLNDNLTPQGFCEECAEKNEEAEKVA